jgi:hypothetical protein
MRFGKVIWSLVELEWLKENRDNISIDQMTIRLAKSRNAIINKLKEFDGKVVPGKKNKKSIIGKRPDLNNIFFRSGWEADTARYFNEIGWKDWMFEPRCYFFEGEKRGAISYLPDFYIPSQDIYVEVKGFLDSKGRSALKKFKKFYPDEFAKLKAITGSPNTKASKDFIKLGIPVIAYMSDLKKQYRKTISNWETQ